MTNYEHNIHPITTVDTAESFWAVYGHLRRAGQLPSNTDYQLFRAGIRPVWEDPANSSGGKWIVRLRKGLAGRLWEHLMLALISGYLWAADGEASIEGDSEAAPVSASQMAGDVSEEICGIVLSVRYNEDIIALWNRTASNEATKKQLCERMRRAMSLPPGTPFEYKAHDTAMKDSSSFKNADKIK